MLVKKIKQYLAGLTVCCVAFLCSSMVMAADFDEQLSLNGETLYLNGTGPRKKAFLTLYDTALYLTEKGTDGGAIVASDHPMAISMVIESKLVTPSRISEAIEEGFEKSTASNTADIESQIATFLDVFSAGVVKDDAFQFAYMPSEGTSVYKNGASVAVIEGLAFKQALFGIWLSDEPVTEKLKKQLLGN